MQDPSRIALKREATSVGRRRKDRLSVFSALFALLFLTDSLFSFRLSCLATFRGDVTRYTLVIYERPIEGSRETHKFAFVTRPRWLVVASATARRRTPLSEQYRGGEEGQGDNNRIVFTYVSPD